MSNLVLKLKKAKQYLLLITLSISLLAAVVWLFHDYTLKNFISLIVAYSFLVGAGNWGIIGYRAQTKYWYESRKYKDLITLLISGIGFIITIVIFGVFIYNYYNSAITISTWSVGALTLGGILRL